VDRGQACSTPPLPMPRSARLPLFSSHARIVTAIGKSHVWIRPLVPGVLNHHRISCIFNVRTGASASLEGPSRLVLRPDGSFQKNLIPAGSPCQINKSIRLVVDRLSRPYAPRYDRLSVLIAQFGGYPRCLFVFVFLFTTSSLHTSRAFKLNASES
jgi:hypothetical protein